MTHNTGITETEAARIYLEECERRAAGAEVALEAKKAELDELEAAGSADYTRLATLEGEKLGLEKVLEGRRSALEAARAALAECEAAEARQGQIERMVSIAGQMQALRDAQHAEVRELAALLEPIKARLAERYLALLELKEQRRVLSAELGAGEYLSYSAWKYGDEQADREKAAHNALLEDVRRAGGCPDSLMLVCEPFTPDDANRAGFGKVLSWNLDALPRDTPELAAAADIAALAIRQKAWK